jgi:hypothetical protein
MKTLAPYLLALILTACTSIDDLRIPDHLPPGHDHGDDEGHQEPDSPQLPGAWQPCDGWDDSSCSPAELGCYLPSSQDVGLTGHCTWICETGDDCADLWVDQGAVPTCIPFQEKKTIGVCALGCEADQECPEGMRCHEVETNPGLTAKICTWEAVIE